MMYQDLLADAIREAVIAMRGDNKPQDQQPLHTKKEEE
ncbi:hypothetical protein UABAM_00761 [Candidatus Uabimicrobium amorphum]|uniref:Uncharacterized protein n=1 Tax=Uabimicrobium amorphum TaxID=2596890 RepID=A0A5S9F1H5_UABAM|nr:hypothetical protein UABAM_00761 [Candidatus Uabimicrobium amorphum]